MEPKQIKTKAFVMCLSLACFFYVAEITAGSIVPKGMMSLIFVGCVRLIEIMLFVTILGENSLGLEKHRLFHGFRKGLIWSAAFGLPVIVIALGLWLHGMNPLKMLRSKMPDQTAELLIFYCVGGLIAPVAEEIFFRGILYGYFRRWGIAAALICSTSLFFAAHVGGGMAQAVGGILFAIAYESEGNLMTPIVIHSLGNLALFTISLL